MWGLWCLDPTWLSVKLTSSSEVVNQKIEPSGPGAVLLTSVSCTWVYGICWSFREGLDTGQNDEVVGVRLPSGVLGEQYPMGMGGDSLAGRRAHSPVAVGDCTRDTNSCV